MKTFEVILEKFDYVFSKQIIKLVDFFDCKSESEVLDLVYWKFGDSVDILSVDEFENRD